MTDTERRLWTHLRVHRLAEHKFKRQQPIGPYIVDFVCFASRLVIEVDGGQHQHSESDQLRDAWLQEHGYRVLRFWDNDVLTNLAGVLETVAGLLPPLPDPSPARGEGSEAARDASGEVRLRRNQRTDSPRPLASTPRGRDSRQ
jgi:very-short-patch-repair endonuclease